MSFSFREVNLLTTGVIRVSNDKNALDASFLTSGRVEEDYSKKSSQYKNNIIDDLLQLSGNQVRL